MLVWHQVFTWVGRAETDNGPSRVWHRYRVSRGWVLQVESHGVGVRVICPSASPHNVEILTMEMHRVGVKQGG